LLDLLVLALPVLFTSLKDSLIVGMIIMD